MKTILRSGTILGGLLVLAMPSLAVAVDVSDAAHFFSAEALEKANAAIREIEKKSGHEIRIETHATVPADKVEAVAKMDREKRQEFMNQWTKDRAREFKENGTLILICKEPAHAKTWFSGKLKEAGLTQSDCNQVSEALVAGLKAKNYDGALNGTVAKLGTAYSKLGPVAHKLHATNNAPIRRAPAPGVMHPVPAQRPIQSSWMPVISIIAMVLFGIFVISMLSRLFGGGGRGVGGGGGYGGQPGFGGGGGGGFMRSLAGGIFGAVAGNWLYDSFSGHSAHAHDSVPLGSDQGSALGDDTSTSDSGWTDEGSSGGGGWFDGGDSGGGGGGDFGGGGDSGGGDFGGGGDF